MKMENDIKKKAKEKLKENEEEGESSYRETEADFRITNLESSLMGMLPGQIDSRRR